MAKKFPKDIPDTLRELPKCLFQECPTCNGVGNIKSKEWEIWWKCHQSDWQDAYKAGDIPNVPEVSVCELCEGKGKVATQLGFELHKALVELQSIGISPLMEKFYGEGNA